MSNLNIDFFEEFPGDIKNLEKVKLIDFDSTIYIASKNLDEFLEYKKQIKHLNKKVDCAWWPIIESSYWISSFSKTEDLEFLLNEFKKYKLKAPLKVLLDLELPILKPKLFLKNFFSFRRNKRIIKSIFNNKSINLDIRTAEYPFGGKFMSFILRIFGVNYSIKKYSHKKIMMYYSSMIPRWMHKGMKKRIVKRHKQLDDNLQIGLGTIAIGILGNEPILKPKNLESDLKFLIENNIKDIVMFRLGGLDKKYLKVIKKYN